MPTKVTKRFATLIDRIYYSDDKYKNNNNLLTTGNMWCDITDYLANYVLLLNNRDNQGKKPTTIN